jgi:hypothetical protein
MATPPAISFVEGRPDRDIHRDLLNLRSYIYGLDNDVWLSPGEALHDTTAIFSNGWPALSLANAAATGARFSRYLPRLWVGSKAHMEWFISEASTDAGNFRIRAAFSQSDDLNGEVISSLTPTLTEDTTDAAGAASTPKRITSSSFTISGRHVAPAFIRLGADAADTATVALILWGGLLVRE